MITGMNFVVVPLNSIRRKTAAGQIGDHLQVDAARPTGKAKAARSLMFRIRREDYDAPAFEE